MCTAISVTAGDNYFGRNLDYESTFGEKITITPRNYPFSFSNAEEVRTHYAMIGMALPYDDYPLYFDATNEKGLSAAGLRFEDNAYYMEESKAKNNIASFELIPRILCSCRSVSEAVALLENANITNHAFNVHFPPSPLHFIVADKENSITVEQTRSGLKIYENPVGVLANNPTFDMQLLYLRNFLSVSSGEPENKFSDKINLTPYSRGMGGIGLPGDLSSMSRFIRACFTKLNSVFEGGEEEIVAQFFHILYSVYQTRGCVQVGDNFEITNYTSCCNTDKGIYYYTTYNNSCICSVDMFKENLESSLLITYDLQKTAKIHLMN